MHIKLRTCNHKSSFLNGGNLAKTFRKDLFHFRTSVLALALIADCPCYAKSSESEPITKASNEKGLHGLVFVVFF
jgi:hypothetical protein